MDFTWQMITYIDEKGEETGEEVDPTDGNPTLMAFIPVFVLSYNNYIR
jgi:hypothetical protein